MLDQRKEPMKKDKLVKRLVWIGVATLTTTLVWTALDGYHRLVDDQLSTRFGSLLEPLDSTLNSQVIDQLEKKRKYGFEELDYSLTPTVKISTDQAEVAEGSAGGQTSE